MTSYCNINNAYSENSNLDKLARQINNQYPSPSLINPLSDFNDSDSLYNVSIDSQTLDSFLDVAKNDKLINKHNDLHDIVQNIHHTNCIINDETMFDHIKYCKLCKNNLLSLIQNLKTPPVNNNPHNISQIKEFLVILLIGIFIMILLDIFLKSSLS